MSVAAVVLAAGTSRRLGRAKQAVVLGGETLLERAVRVALEAGLWPVIVVLRAGNEPESLLSLAHCDVVTNEQASEGLASSIRCGVAKAIGSGAQGAVLMTCDQVALSAEHLRRLSHDTGRLRGSGYGGKTGVPAYFPASSFRALLALRGDIGARELLSGADVVMEEGLALDIDTAADIERAERLMGADEFVRSKASEKAAES